MTAEVKSILNYNLAHPRADWALPPMLPGAWTERLGDEARDIIMTIENVSPSDGMAFSNAFHIDRVRTRPLACHGGVLLVEMQGYDPQPGLMSVILHQNGVVRLDGQSIPIHQFNGQTEPALYTNEARTDYALLFMNWVHGAADGGRFQPLLGDIVFAHRVARDDAQIIGAIEAHRNETIVFQQVESEQKSEAWDFSVSILYGNALFDAQMRIHAYGMMEMIDDDPVLEVPLLTERMQGRLLRLASNASEVHAI